MAAITLATLRNEVYRRLGDRGYFATSSNPTVATLTAVDAQINAACRYLIREAESLGTFPLTANKDITVSSGTQEYDLDANLVDAASKPNLRADLFIVRSDLDNPLPVLWPMGGDHRFSLFLNYCEANYRWPMPAILTWSQPLMYRRGKYVGFVTTPTEDMTLTCYYTPKVPLFSGAVGTELLSTDICTLLESWDDLIAVKAAMQLGRDANLRATLELEFGLAMQQFREEMGRAQLTVVVPRRSRWSG